jgi:hypothetical protein
MLADLDPMRLQRGHGRCDSLRHETSLMNKPATLPRKLAKKSRPQLCDLYLTFRSLSCGAQWSTDSSIFFIGMPMSPVATLDDIDLKLRASCIQCCCSHDSCEPFPTATVMQ